jgi:hypothetical protein
LGPTQLPLDSRARRSPSRESNSVRCHTKTEHGLRAAGADPFLCMRRGRYLGQWFISDWQLVETPSNALGRLACKAGQQPSASIPVGFLFAEYCSFVPPRTNTARRLKRQE